MLKVLQDNLVNTARPRALSSYNFLGQHDLVRLWSDTDTQKNDISATVLLQMTYLGSPVIYYGDEIGLTNGANNNQAFSQFNWDESQWNYDILNLVKTLGKARQEYSCLKDGVICHGEVDDRELFLAFGRFDKNGAAITLCNKQGVAVEKEINVSRYGVKDGQELLDYLTGVTYKVKNGKVTVNVIPGGTLLVTGSKSSVSRGKYTISNIGKDIEVVQKDAAVFEVSGKGTLKGKKDAIGFVSTKAFNNVTLQASIEADKGTKPVLMFRDSEEKNSAFYAVVVDNNKLTILCRNKAGAKVTEVASVKILANAQVQIARGNGNSFVASYRENEEAEWTQIKESVACAAISEDMYAGMTSLNGTCEFSQVVLTETENQICDDFDSKTLGSMFSALAKGMKLKDGKLMVESLKDKLVYASANAHASDFTFKSKVRGVKLDSNADLSIAGVMSMADENDAVMLVRTVIDGKNVLAFGKQVDGKW